MQRESSDPTELIVAIVILPPGFESFATSALYALSALPKLSDTLSSGPGKKLFDGERKSHLSPLGEEVYELAQHQLRQFDHMVQSIETTANASNGLIRIASVPSVAALVFPHVLSQITERIPGVKIELRDTDTRQVLDALDSGKADIGIASGFHALNRVAATQLFEDQFGLISAANHPLIVQSQPPSIAEVVTTEFVRNTLCDLI